MKPAPFRYIRPDSKAEAVAALRRGGDDSRIIAGGMSLGAMLNMRLITPATLIDIGRVRDLSAIDVGKTHIRIEAAVRQNDALADARLDTVPLLKLALPNVGHFQTRNRGTICGSVAHADPSAELPLALLVADGAVELDSVSGRRVVAADKFFVSTLTTSRRADELVTATRWPTATPNTGWAFAEFAIRSGDYAIAAAAAAVTLSPSGTITVLRVGVAGIGERPMLIDTATLLGATPGEAVANEIENLTRRAIDPPSDLQASSAYRRHLAGVLARQVFDEATARARVRSTNA